MDAEAVLKHRVRNEQTSGEKKSPSKGVLIFYFFPAHMQIFRQIRQTFGSRRERVNLLIQHTVSRWCSSGRVHEGCGGVDHWLQTGDWALQIFFYRQPTRQASTECPLPALKQLNFWMQISSQLSRFMNSNNDHCDLDFSLTVCDILGWPYRGHEAVSEDPMLKRGGGVCGPPMALV
jgi:hypothetical protein